MAKTNSVAKSKVSASKSSINRIIEDFTGTHSVDDITPKPIGEEPVHIVETDIETHDNTLIEELTMPATRIPDDNRDPLQKKIDAHIKGQNSQ